MYGLLSGRVSDPILLLAACAAGFILTYLLLRFPPSFLPKDQGRAFAVNGALSKGKVRGVGLIFVAVFLLVPLILLPVNREYCIYGGLVFLMMLSGYLDDASKNPWSDYKKGAIDLVISILTVVNFLMNHEPEILILHTTFVLPKVVYALLGIALIWVSVNVTNCSDGVDGLCGSVSVAALVAYAFLCHLQGSFLYTASAALLAAVLLAYLRFNWHPSTMLMGDAGSRAIGIYLAILAMVSRHPLSFLLIGLVFILDGGLGLVKVFVMRFFKIPFLTKIRFPLHDQMRKNMGMKDVPVVLFMLAAQVVLSLLACLLIR